MVEKIEIFFLEYLLKYSDSSITIMITSCAVVILKVDAGEGKDQSPESLNYHEIPATVVLSNSDEA